VVRIRRTDLSEPGIRRRRAGRGFVYLEPSGSRLQDRETLARIRALAIPPAWTDVWICPAPQGHIQAVGTDAKGRRQYLYHQAWRERRDKEKFDRVLQFGRKLPKLREVADRDLGLEGMPREKILACTLYLLDAGFFRIGGEEYAEENGSYGLASLGKQHARVVGESVVFEYPAKSGRERIQSVVDPRIRQIVTSLKRRRGGECLLAYKAADRWVELRSDEINAHIRATARIDVTAKDYRTWNGTVLAAVALAVSWPASRAPTARKRALQRAIKEVAAYLGNTPAVCRRSYIDPRVVDLYMDGITIRQSLGRLADDPDAALATHGAAERAVLRLLDA
jgi:DNA topoisomerase I